MKLNQLYRSVVLLLGTALAACTDGNTAPSRHSATAPAVKSIEDYSRPFVAGTDTTILDSWSTSHSGSCYEELRTNGYNAAGASVVYRSVYVTGNDACAADENQPLIEFRPHENTREKVNVEVYSKSALGILSRGLSKDWYYYQNGLGQQDDLDFPAEVTLRWTPVSYDVASRSIAPSSVDVDAGAGVTLVARAYASNGAEIFNQPTTSFTISNPSVASLSSTSGVSTPSTFGAPFNNWTTTLNALQAGTATVTTQFQGSVLTTPVTVRPHPTLTGQVIIPAGTTNTYSVSVTGCAGSCTMHWTLQYVANGLPATRDLGTFTGTSSSVNVTWGNRGSETLSVDVTSNGVGNTAQLRLTEQSGSGGGSCPPDQRIC